MPAPDFVKITDISGKEHRLKWDGFQGYEKDDDDGAQTRLFWVRSGDPFSIVVRVTVNTIDAFLTSRGIVIASP